MKNVLSVVCIAFIGFLNAQEIGSRVEVKSEGEKTCRNRFHLGVKVGANYSNVYDDEGDAFLSEPKYGFAGGGFIDIPFGNIFGIHPEVLFSQKGFKAKGSVLGTNYDLIRTTSYLDVPVLLAVKPVCPVTLLVGPQYSYLLQQTDVFAAGLNSSAQSEKFENESIRKNILGAVFGVDINIWNMLLSARYGIDLQKNNGDGTSSTPRYKNVWFQGTLGFRIF